MPERTQSGPPFSAAGFALEFITRRDMGEYPNEQTAVTAMFKRAMDVAIEGRPHFGNVICKNGNLGNSQ